MQMGEAVLKEDALVRKIMGAESISAILLLSPLNEWPCEIFVCWTTAVTSGSGDPKTLVAVYRTVLTTKGKYAWSFIGLAVLFASNAVFLYFAKRYGWTSHADPFYTAYLRLRDFLLRPASILSISGVLLMWFSLLYWRSRKRPLSDQQKIVFMCMVLSVIGGVYFDSLF